MNPQILETNNLKIYPTEQTIDQKLGLPSVFEDRNAVYIVSGGRFREIHLVK